MALACKRQHILPAIRRRKVADQEPHVFLRKVKGNCPCAVIHAYRQNKSLSVTRHISHLMAYQAEHRTNLHFIRANGLRGGLYGGVVNLLSNGLAQRSRHNNINCVFTACELEADQAKFFENPFD